ncbi:MATE family efflux transporter [Paenibacillus rhizoplanae]
MALLNLTDQLMVGQLGDVAIASVGISTKIYGIIAVVLAGLSTGVSIYAAQFLGEQGFQKCLPSAGSRADRRIHVLFPVLCGCLPGFAALFLSLFTTDVNVIDEGYIFPSGHVDRLCACYAHDDVFRDFAQYGPC